MHINKCCKIQHHYVTQTIFNHIKYQVKIFTNATNIEHIEIWLNDKSFNHINNITLFMFTKNGNLRKGVVNGAATTIKSIIFYSQNNVTTIEVQLTNKSTKMIIKKRHFQHKYKYDGYYYKTSFLIVVTYTMISHKSQSATIATKVVIDIKNLSHPTSYMSCFSKSQIKTTLK